MTRPALDGPSEQVDWKSLTVSFAVASAECAPGALALTVQMVGNADASMLSNATVEAEFVLESITLEDVPCPPTTV